MPPASPLPALSPLETPYLAPRGAEPARVTLGTMNFGKRTSAAEAARIMDRAVERGVALFDTANMYTDGESERIVGRAVAARRDRVVLATKVGYGRAGGKAEGLSRAAITKALDESLGRLATDYIDVYYLHGPDHATPIEETIDAMAEQIAKGRVRHFGVSNFASWQILEVDRLCDERALPRPRISQVMYNLLIRQVEIEYLPFARKYPIHTTVYNPLAGGLLTDRYQVGDSVAAGSRFDKNKLYQKRYWSERMLELVQSYRALAAEAQMSIVDLAYAWLASAPGVDSILVGPGSVEHLDAALDAVGKEVSSELRDKARAIHEAFTGTDASYAR
jgi:aryl-alcohol dehydrogenase-like predicted oxidoreductase